MQRGPAWRRHDKGATAGAVAGSGPPLPREPVQQQANQQLRQGQPKQAEKRAGMARRARPTKRHLLLSIALLLLLPRLQLWQLACVCVATAVWLPAWHRSPLWSVAAPVYAGSARYLALAAGEPGGMALAQRAWRGGGDAVGCSACPLGLPRSCAAPAGSPLSGWLAAAAAWGLLLLSLSLAAYLPIAMHGAARAANQPACRESGRLISWLRWLQAAGPAE